MRDEIEDLKRRLQEEAKRRAELAHRLDSEAQEQAKAERSYKLSVSELTQMLETEVSERKLDEVKLAEAGQARDAALEQLEAETQRKGELALRLEREMEEVVRMEKRGAGTSLRSVWLVQGRI